MFQKKHHHGESYSLTRNLYKYSEKIYMSCQAIEHVLMYTKCDQHQTVKASVTFIGDYRDVGRFDCVIIPRGSMEMIKPAFHCYWAI